MSGPWFRAAFAAPLLFLAACSGGGEARVSHAQCAGGATFCLVSCNLGCVGGSCSVTDIAVNQTIEFEFNQAVDPTSVNPQTVSIKTLNGVAAAGKFVVGLNRVTFIPEVSFLGGSTRFGFTSGEVYLLSLSAERGNSILSTGGDPLASGLTCTLAATRGLVDFDGLPPSAKLLSPVASKGVAPTVEIVVEFSELIDIGAFQSAAVSPVRFRARPALRLRGDPNALECNLAAGSIDLLGVPRVEVDPIELKTRLEFRPRDPLPTSSCVEIVITDRVRDLAGTPAVPAVLRFLTRPADQPPPPLVEDFSTADQLDERRSSSVWGNGRATFGQLGQGGELGSFAPEAGGKLEGDVYWFDTDDTLVPATHTLLRARSILVDDGVFEYTDFVVPAGVKVGFRGSKPARIFVRGDVEIAGTLILNGESVTDLFDPRARFIPPAGWVPTAGQTGAAGGPGGGAGGAGGVGCDGIVAKPENSGQRGEQLRVGPSSGYQADPGLAMTGGPGSSVHPASGRRNDVVFRFNNLCSMVGAGGSGGGFFAAGGMGRAVSSYSGDPADLAPPTPSSSTVSFVLPPAGVSVAEHFLNGGSGGGGGGSTPLNMVDTVVTGALFRPWHAGGGGSGGGGAIAFRAGGRFTIAATGKIECRGGDGVTYADRFLGPPLPGGGGSGGSVLVQTIRAIQQDGVIDLSGGTGSVVEHGQTGTNDKVRIEAGNGAPGYVRFESITPVTAGSLGNVVGPTVSSQNFGQLAEADPVVGMQSLWYRTTDRFPPSYEHYELLVSSGGRQLLFTDNPNPTGPTEGPADVPIAQGGLVELWVQGAPLDASGQPAGPLAPWRRYVDESSGRESINLDSATGARFMVLVNRALSQDVTVESFRIVFGR